MQDTSNTILTEKLQEKMKIIPVFELSYETSSSHRKVYNEDPIPNQIGLFIPKSKKYLVWFTFIEDIDVAILIELGRDKKPVRCKIIENLIFDPDGPKLSQGTILYGSLYHKTETQIYFIIEDILVHLMKSLRKICFGDKLKILEEIFNNKWIQTKFTENCSYAFCFPIGFDGSKDPTEQDIAKVPYPIHHIQYRLFDRIVPYINVILQSKAGEIIHKTMDDSRFIPEKRIPFHTESKRPRTYEPKGKERDVFIVRADLQSDMYILTHPKQLYEDDYAYIPNYRVSVFMNKLFRNIKENDNLDKIEESDDEEELMDTRPDKYVNLNKEYRMECMYHKKFKRWIPLRIITNNFEKQNFKIYPKKYNNYHR